MVGRLHELSVVESVEEVRKPVSSAGAIVLQSMRKSVGVHSFGNKKKS